MIRDGMCERRFRNNFPTESWSEQFGILLELESFTETFSQPNYIDSNESFSDRNSLQMILINFSSQFKRKSLKISHRSFFYNAIEVLHIIIKILERIFHVTFLWQMTYAMHSVLRRNSFWYDPRHCIQIFTDQRRGWDEMCYNNNDNK